MHIFRRGQNGDNFADHEKGGPYSRTRLDRSTPSIMTRCRGHQTSRQSMDFFLLYVTKC
jgi:hypothetical protein